jgi:hypothetical protein
MIHLDIADVIRTQFKIDMAEVYTAIPCKVVNVHGENEQQRVDVVPSVDTLLKDGTTEPGMQILSVPVIFPGSKTTLISFPINVGDSVYCIFSQNSIDNFKIGNGEPTVANDYRKFSDQDAVAIPGLVPFGRSLNRPNIRKYPHSSNKDLCIAHNIASGTEVNIIFKQSGDLIINTEQSVTVNCKTGVVNAENSYEINTPVFNVNAGVTNWSGNINHNGNYTITGVAKFNGVVFDTHYHSGVMSGPSNSGPVAG